MKAGKSRRCLTVLFTLAACPLSVAFMTQQGCFRCMASTMSAYANMALSMSGATALTSLTTSGKLLYPSHTVPAASSISCVLCS